MTLTGAVPMASPPGRLGTPGLPVPGTRARKMATELAESLKQHIEATGRPVREMTT